MKTSGSVLNGEERIIFWSHLNCGTNPTVTRAMNEMNTVDRQTRELREGSLWGEHQLSCGSALKRYPVGFSRKQTQLCLRLVFHWNPQFEVHLTRWRASSRLLHCCYVSYITTMTGDRWDILKLWAMTLPASCAAFLWLSPVNLHLRGATSYLKVEPRLQ